MAFDPAEKRDAHGRWTHLAGLLKESGGFTFSTNTGKEPSSGFAVSLPGHEVKIKGHASAAQIAGYTAQHHRALANPKAHLGGWYNEEDGHTYLDVSHVLKDQGEAEKTARKHKQLAYFDLGTFTEHRVKESNMSKKAKKADLSFLTPTLHSADYDLSATDGKLAFWKQILPMQSIHYTAKDGTRQTIDFTKEYLDGLALATAVDSVGFLLADPENRHTMDPERWRGKVEKFEVRADAEKPGLYGKIVFPSQEAAKAVLDNPELGVSARIRPNVQRSDGSTVPAGIIHVLGTLDPQVSGMSPWQATDLSATQGDVLDLSDEEYEDMADKDKTGVKVEDLDLGDIDKMSDEELDALLTDLGIDLGDYAGADDEDEGDEPDASTQTREPALAGAGADMSSKTAGDIELANQRAAVADARANQALRRVAEAEWREERNSLLGEGVPAHALDLAAPVLNRADDMVIDLSFADEDDVNVSEVVRGLLNALKGTVDLSNEKGHFGMGDGDENPDKDILEAWDKQS